jgi:sugar lactone lactonase YvrE
MKKILFLVFFLLTFTFSTLAGEPSIWSINSRKDVVKGDARGISINDNGSITLAPKLFEVFDTEQPFVWSSAIDPAGNVYLGTGGDGKIFKVDASGKGTLFYDSAELNVSALAVASDGTVYAGTSPDGKIYRISSNGNASVYFEPKEKYIWSLAVLSDGSLAIGTGENGKIYKVKSANANPANSLLFDTSETHIISLATDKNGNLYAGTDSEGLVLRFSADGKPFALLDSPLREIHELAVGVDGSVYVLVLSESASTKETKTDEKKAEIKTVSVEKTNANATPTEQKSRYDLTSAKSAVYRILPDGSNDIIWKSDEITAFAIYGHLTGNGVLIGTSDKGRIYSVRNDGQETLVLQTDEEQVSTIKTNGTRLFATSSNQGKLFRFGGENVAEGIFESPVLDAKSVSNWGTIWWRSSGDVKIQTRSGNTASPNESWTDWSNAYTNPKGAKITSPKAQFLQWRAVLKNSATEAVLNEVNASFLQLNIPPEVLSIEVLPANIGLAPNPSVPVDPNIEALGLDPAEFGIVIPPPVPRKVFQSGAKSLQWNAEDRNGDNLRYSIYYREVGESNFKLLRENVEEPFYTIDGLALADGRYIFKVVANDSLSNPASLALTGERISEPFDIDNTAPTVSVVGTPQVNGESVRVVFEAKENSSFIKRAEYNINGGKWKTVYSDDGISDSQNERYTVNVNLKDSGEYTIALRVFDSSGNAGNARTLIKK